MELQKLADYGARQGVSVKGPGLGKQLTTLKQSLKSQGTPFPAPADSYTPSGERNDGIQFDLTQFETARKLFGR